MRLINRFVVVALTILSIAPVVRADAPNIAADAGISTGVCLWLGDPSLEQLKALAKDGRILTRVLAPEPQVAALRARLQECGIYGLVTVTPRPQTPALPMVSNTVDLIIATEQLTEGSRQEAMRILRPRGMLATPEGARFAFTPKPMPATMDEWRNKHHREDSQCTSRDAELTPPFELRWQDGPIFGACRYSDYLPTVLYAGGRMYSLTPCDVMNLIDLAAPEYHLVARNAFNGVRLWSTPFPAGRTRSDLAACGDRLFVPFDEGWRALDGETGKVVYAISGISSSIDAGIAYCVFSLADGKFLSARPGTGLADLLTRSKTGLYHRATYAGELPKPRGGSTAIVPAERGGFFSAYASVAPMPMEMPRVDTITRQNFGPAKGMLIGHDAAGVCTYNYIAKERKQIPAFISYWSLPTPAPVAGVVPETWRFTHEPASNLPLRTNGVRLLAITLAADAVIAAGFDPAQPAAQRGFVHIYNRADGRRRAAATFADTPTFDGLAVTVAGITLATESGAVLHFR